MKNRTEQKNIINTWNDKSFFGFVFSSSVFLTSAYWCTRNQSLIRIFSFTHPSFLPCTFLCLFSRLFFRRLFGFGFLRLFVSSVHSSFLDLIFFVFSLQTTVLSVSVSPFPSDHLLAPPPPPLDHFRLTLSPARSTR